MYGNNYFVYFITSSEVFGNILLYVVGSLIAQERLDRITQFVNEITLMDSVPHCITEHDQLDENYDSPQKFSCSEWMGHAIPVDSVSGLLSSPGLSSERDIPAFLFRNWEPHSPESVSTSEASDFSHVKELEKENRKGWQHYDDCTSENSGSRSDSFERVNGMLENGQASPDVGTMYCSRLERVESLESLQR